MAMYQLEEIRRPPDDHEVSLYKDMHDGSWFVGRKGDPALDPVPLGGFASAAAARRWADARFEGGSWQPASGPPLRV